MKLIDLKEKINITLKNNINEYLKKIEIFDIENINNYISDINNWIVRYLKNLTQEYKFLVSINCSKKNETIVNINSSGILDPETDDCINIELYKNNITFYISIYCVCLE